MDITFVVAFYTIVLGSLLAFLFKLYFAPAPKKPPADSEPHQRKARTESEGSETAGGSPKTKAAKKVRSIRKRLYSIDELVALKAGGQALDNDQAAKVARRRELELELKNAEAQLVQEAKERAWAEEVERNKREERILEEKKSLSVRFDDNFACPICCEVMESATMIDACSHIFCRDCALSVVESKKCLCPLCRAPFTSKQLKPATSMRKKMAKHTGTCHCGAEVPLSKLRAHLRACNVTDEEQPKYNKNQPLSQADMPITESRAQSDYVRHSDEAAILERVLEQSRQEYEWSSIYGNRLVAAN